MIAVATEAPTNNLGKNGSTTLDSMLITFKNNGSSATTRNQTITILIEGTTGLGRFIFASRECLDAIKTSHAIHVCLLSTASDNAIRQAILDEQIGITYCQRRTCTCCTACEVDATQTEQTCQIHGYGAVHALENGTTTASTCLLEFTETVQGNHCCFSNAIVTINNTYFVRIDIILIQACML